MGMLLEAEDCRLVMKPLTLLIGDAILKDSVTCFGVAACLQEASESFQRFFDHLHVHDSVTILTAYTASAGPDMVSSAFSLSSLCLLSLRNNRAVVYLTGLLSCLKCCVYLPTTFCTAVLAAYSRFYPELALCTAWKS